MKKLLPILALSALSLGAETITSNTDVFYATLDQESNGLHVQVTGRFSYNPTGALIGIPDLTYFSMDVQEYLTNSTTAPGYDFTVGMSAIDNFSFDPNTDLLSAQITVLPDDPTSGIFSIGPNSGPEAAMLGIDALEIGWLGHAYGPASDPPIPGYAVPEPANLAAFGLGLIGLAGWGKSRKTID